MDAMSKRYWVIEESELASKLRRVANGESPDVVLLEMYANSDTEQVEGDRDV
jgi:hypothetical protein